MSLDISADLLVSEYAPVPAMIQRLGRLNRFEEIPRQVKKAIFIQPTDCPAVFRRGLPGAQGMDLCCGRWNPQVPAGAIAKPSSTFLRTRDRGQRSPCQLLSWVDGLWRSLKDQRTIEEASFSIEVIREEDRDENPIEMAIPMPIPKGGCLERLGQSIPILRSTCWFPIL